MLEVLENKIKLLIGRIKKLQEENVRLVSEKVNLKRQMESFENAAFKKDKNLEKVNEEKALAKSVIDDLIKSIDSLTLEEKRCDG